MKKETIISGVEMGTLQKGKPCTILVGDKWYMTSPVLRYFVGGSKVFIETENSIYKN